MIYAPAKSIGCKNTGAFDFCGLSFHIRSTRFCGGYTSFAFLCWIWVLSSVAFSCEIMRASIPILLSWARSFFRKNRDQERRDRGKTAKMQRTTIHSIQSFGSLTPPALINLQLPSSCCRACDQYRESVKRYASFMLTIAVPAVPKNLCQGEKT